VYFVGGNLKIQIGYPGSITEIIHLNPPARSIFQKSSKSINELARVDS